mmetsp:Transcript_25773/g.60427  ORF Transcript_25773/g.60427 Transcript_25773/m.60427 type:complete len:95 (+) Transcript_25773:704-988(+)
MLLTRQNKNQEKITIAGPIRWLNVAKKASHCAGKKRKDEQSYYKFSDETSKLLRSIFLETEDMEAKRMSIKNDAIEQAPKRFRSHRKLIETSAS